MLLRISVCTGVPIFVWVLIIVIWLKGCLYSLRAYFMGVHYPDVTVAHLRRKL